ncbi:WEB family protein At3g02930, chloroplastic-like [Hibiscus syriacus]|uniref:WEB family protein At3g02930, chloroplastic-like n=1 Tax=Hibiscus syriacus TaxID=106335 RepID=UPI00192076A6|nr:WEB family protein At3g02930, chloroplastic-like [Hibiscus syriacus]
MSAKSKSGLSETHSKASPATPRVASKLSKGLSKSEPDSSSPLQSTRHSIDRPLRSSLNTKSPSLNLKPSIDRKSAKAAAPAEKPQTRVSKGSELQAQLNSVLEDLKKAKEEIALIEKEKSQAIDELKEAQKAAEEANEKLREAVVAQKRAEESSEIEKFRALELEQAGIEAARKKGAEWEKEIESMKNQHTLDVAALLSASEELQKVKQELSAICDEKNQALSHADDATKIAETHAEKVEILSAELVQLKSLLDLKHETEAIENNEMILNLKAEIESLKQQLENAKIYKEKLMEKEAVVEQLNLELEAATMAESYAHNVLEECKKRVEELEMHIEEAKKLERSASESLESVMKQLENNNDSLHDAESEIAALKEKVSLLEMTVGRQRGDLEESEIRIIKAKEESAEAEKLVESLKSELETMKEENIQALDNEKLAASSVQALLEEKNKLITDLENSRDEEEKSKKAMENLASALHEVSAEAREAKEKLLSIEAEHGHYETQLEDLRLVLKAKNEKYETMLDDAKNEIDFLTNTIEQSKNEYQNSKTEWEQKELHLVDCVKKSEEENSSLEKEINRMVNLLKKSEEEASASKEEEAQLKESLKEVESELIYLQEALKDVKTESMELKESLLDKETELQSVVQENEELRGREAASLKKIVELSKLLEEATIKKQNEKNGELSDSENDYDLLPKVVEFSEVNGHGIDEKHKLELPAEQPEKPEKESLELNDGSKDEDLHVDGAKVESSNGKLNHDETKGKEDDSVEVEFKMWESCKIETKEFSPGREPEQESFDEEVESKVESIEAERLDQINGSTENTDDGGISPSKQQQQQKKKNPLLRKFGSLLKKKGSNNPK